MKSAMKVKHQKPVREQGKAMPVCSLTPGVTLGAPVGAPDGPPDHSMGIARQASLCNVARSLWASGRRRSTAVCETVYLCLIIYLLALLVLLLLLLLCILLMIYPLGNGGW